MKYNEITLKYKGETVDNYRFSTKFYKNFKKSKGVNFIDKELSESINKKIKDNDNIYKIEMLFNRCDLDCRMFLSVFETSKYNNYMVYLSDDKNEYRVLYSEFYELWNFVNPEHDKIYINIYAKKLD